MKKITFIIILFIFFFYNIRSINTIDSIVLMYEQDNIYEEDIFNINFFSFNIMNIPQIFKDLDIKIISVKPEENLYYKKSIKAFGNTYEEITKNLLKDYSTILNNNGYVEQSYYFEQKGFNITSMKIRCIIKELIELEKRVKII